MHIFKLIGFWCPTSISPSSPMSHTHIILPIIVTIGIIGKSIIRDRVGRKTLFALPKHLFGLVFLFYFIIYAEGRQKYKKNIICTS